MRYVHTRTGDEEVRRSDVEYVHLKLCAFGIVVMIESCGVVVQVSFSSITVQ